MVSAGSRRLLVWIGTIHGARYEEGRILKR
jgi:hypothetical protein